MAKDKIHKNISIKNRRASYEYEFIDTYVAGMVLKGTEIKSIRQQKVSLQEAYCLFHGSELFIRGMHIAPYEEASFKNHDPIRERKLLLNKKELGKLEDKLKDKGLTIIPVKLFITDRGFAKLEIALAKGKKLFDKRENLKEKDAKREMKKLDY